jgi:cardiolipin synthase
MQDQILEAVEALARMAPSEWLEATSAYLKAQQTNAPTNQVVLGLPATSNPDLNFLFASLATLADNQVSWEAIGWMLSAVKLHVDQQASSQPELLFTGPKLPDSIQIRRIDQALYDLIGKAQREIILVTYAAAKISILTKELLAAVDRGVKVSLILEFEQTSEGQLSYDAIRAFPEELIRRVKVFYWPVEKRERNEGGRPGKLHAKVAIVDDFAISSSANLTDDAFNRNIEMGILVRDHACVEKFKIALNALYKSKFLVTCFHSRH